MKLLALRAVRFFSRAKYDWRRSQATTGGYRLPLTNPDLIETRHLSIQVADK